MIGKEQSPPPLPVDDVYVLAATELLLPSEEPPAKCAAARQSLESRARAWMLNTARGRRAAWLAAVVVLTFGVQVLLAGLVAAAALPTVPGWLESINTMIDYNRTSTLPREHQVDQFLAAVRDAGREGEVLRRQQLPDATQKYAGRMNRTDVWAWPLDRDTLMSYSCRCALVAEQRGTRTIRGINRTMWTVADDEDRPCAALPECFLCEWDIRNRGWDPRTENHLVGGGAPACDITVVKNGTNHSVSADVLYKEDYDLFAFVALYLHDLDADILMDFVQLTDDLPALTGMSVAVSFAVVLIVITVHREVARAHLLARLVLTHTGCMPPMFAPLASPAAEPLVSWQRRWPAALGLLALPLLQLSAALCVLLSASTVFARTDETKDLITIIFNSAALLFVLELDNVVGGVVKQRRRTVGWAVSASRDSLELQEGPPSGDSVQGGAPRSAVGSRRRFIHAVGHVYVAMLGLLAIGELYFATSGIAWTYVSMLHNSKEHSRPSDEFLMPVEYAPQTEDALLHAWRVQMGTFVSQYRTSAAACSSFAVAFIVSVALLFDAPLPSRSTLWMVAAKVVLVVSAALISVAMNQAGGLEWGVRILAWAAIVFPLISWAVLYIAVPWALPRCGAAGLPCSRGSKETRPARAAHHGGSDGGIGC